MKLLWQIENNDIQKVKEFYKRHKKNVFVLNRIKRNVEREGPNFSKEIFWRAMISCLLTTQQRSGPNSSVTKFICTKPFPLNYSRCKASVNPGRLVEETINDFGGLRRAKTIAEQVEYNFIWLENSGWQIINEIVKKLKNNQESRVERESAEIIMDNLKGFAQSNQEIYYNH
jgi:hypothetical protein